MIKSDMINLPARASILALSVIFAAGPAAAESFGNCYWDGADPACVGHCRGGFVERGRQSCLFGYKVFCCEPLAAVSQGQQAPLTRWRSDAWRRMLQHQPPSPRPWEPRRPWPQR
jgi:hypothetical protein